MTATASVDLGIKRILQVGVGHTESESVRRGSQIKGSLAAGPHRLAKTTGSWPRGSRHRRITGRHAAVLRPRHVRWKIHNS